MITISICIFLGISSTPYFFLNTAFALCTEVFPLIQQNTRCDNDQVLNNRTWCLQWFGNRRLLFLLVNVGQGLRKYICIYSLWLPEFYLSFLVYTSVWRLSCYSKSNNAEKTLPCSSEVASIWSATTILNSLSKMEMTFLFSIL